MGQAGRQELQTQPLAVSDRLTAGKLSTVIAVAVFGLLVDRNMTGGLNDVLSGVPVYTMILPALFAEAVGYVFETVRIEEGKISRIRLFLDEKAALEAAGLRE